MPTVEMGKNICCVSMNAWVQIPSAHVQSQAFLCIGGRNERLLGLQAASVTPVQ